MFPYVKEVELLVSNTCVLSNLIKSTTKDTIAIPVNQIMEEDHSSPITVTPILMNCMSPSENELYTVYSHYDVQRQNINDMRQDIFCKLVIVGATKDLPKVHERLINSILNLPVQLCKALINLIQCNVLSRKERSGYNISIYNIESPNYMPSENTTIYNFNDSDHRVMIGVPCCYNEETYANIKKLFTKSVNNFTSAHSDNNEKFTLYIEYYRNLLENILIQIEDTIDQTCTHFVFMNGTWMMNFNDEIANDEIYRNKQYNSSTPYVRAVTKNYYLVQVRHLLDLRNHNVFTSYSPKNFPDYSHRIAMLNKYYTYRGLEIAAQLILSKNYKKEYHFYNKSNSMINRYTFTTLFNIFAHNFILYLLKMYTEQLKSATSTIRINESYRFSNKRLPFTQTEIDNLPTRDIQLHCIQSNPTERIHGDMTIIDDFRKAIDKRLECLDIFNNACIGNNSISDVLYDHLDETTPLQLNCLQMHFDYCNVDDSIELSDKRANQDLCIIYFTLYRRTMQFPPSSKYLNYYARGLSQDLIQESIRKYKNNNSHGLVNAFMDHSTSIFNATNLNTACYMIANRVCEYINDNSDNFLKPYTIDTYLTYIREQIREIVQYIDKYSMEEDNNPLIKVAPYIPYRQSIEDFIAKVNYYGAPMNYQLHWHKIA